jgi:hypothetical protein
LVYCCQVSIQVGGVDKEKRKLKIPKQEELAQEFLGLITEGFAHHRSYRETGQRGAYDQWVEDFQERVKAAILRSCT